MSRTQSQESAPMLFEMITINGQVFQVPLFKLIVGADGVDGGDVSAANPIPTTAGGGGVSHIIVDSGTLTAIINALPAGTNLMGKVGIDQTAGQNIVSQTASTVPAAVVMQNAVSANANGTVLVVTGYATAMLNITSGVAMSGGTIVNFEASTDGSEWQAILAHQIGVTGSQVLTTSTDGDYRINCAGFINLRARISAYSAGTVTVKGYVSVVSGVPTTINVSAITSGVNSGTSDSGGPVKVGGVYNAAQPTLTSGQRGDLQLDTRANEMINLATRIDPVNDQIGAMPLANSQSVAITSSGAGYVSGRGLGGIISLTTVNYASGRRVKLKSMTIKDKGGVAPALHAYFFKLTPAAGTYGDNVALVFGTGDAANLVGSLSVLSGDYITDNSQSFVSYSGIDLDMTVSATTLFMLLVVQGSYTITNNNFTMQLEFDQE